MATHTESAAPRFQSSNIAIAKAGHLEVGDQVAEADGFLFEIVKIDRTSAMTTIYLASDFSSMRKFHKCNGGVPKTMRSSTKVYCVPKAKEVIQPPKMKTVCGDCACLHDSADCMVELGECNCHRIGGYFISAMPHEFRPVKVEDNE